MTENFLFKALFISLAAHTAILCAAYLNKIHGLQYKAIREHRMEISYKPHYLKPVDIRERPIRPAQHLDLNSNQRLFSDGSIPVAVGPDKPALPFGMFYERKPEPMRAMELSRRISIMPVSSGKINNPVYAAYNEMVRERIKQRVYANYDKMEAGRVYLSFLVNDQGVLEGAQIIAAKTDASGHLQDMALRSLKEAAPFPPFFKGMNLKEYPFNIEIEYQVSD